MRKLSLPSGPLQPVCLAAHPDDTRSLREDAACPYGGAMSRLAHAASSPERRIEGKSAATAFLPNSQSSFPPFLMVAFPRSGTKSTDVLGNFAAAPLEADLVLRPRMDDTHQDHRLLGKMCLWFGLMLWSFTTRFRSGIGSSADPTVTWPSRPVER
jgi:hypothetical protein